MIKQWDTLQDISMLSNVDKELLVKLSELGEISLISCVHDTKLKGADTCVCDVGIGKIVIDFSVSDEIIYKFVPSKNLTDEIHRDIIENIEPTITMKLQKIISKKLNAVYKDLV